MRPLTRASACLGLLAFGACGQVSSPAPARLFTLFDVEALYAAGGPDAGSQAIAADDGLPGGIPLGLIVTNGSSGSTLTPRPAWADGQKVWFATTEAWAGYPRVWTQPAYLPVAPAVDGSLQPLTGSGAPLAPIFSVGPASGFYSPFWQIVYAEVPAGTPPGALTSARQVLDGGYPLTPGPGRLMPLTPAGLGPPAAHAGALGPPVTGFLDGAQVQYFDFGRSMFTWDPATNVVAAANIYVLTFVGPDKKLLSTPAIPTVLGAAPPGSGAALPDGGGLSNGGQRNVAYWQVVTVQVPEGAAVFAPPNAIDPVTMNPLAPEIPAGVNLGTYSAAITSATPADVKPFAGRVAVDPSCFADLTTLPGCTWLDSEAALQANVDLSLAQPTAITVTWELTTTIDSNGHETPIPLVTSP